MYTYEQRSGRLSNGLGLVGIGYSGHGMGVNNPALEEIPNVGPIPVGTYEIGPACEHPQLGPLAMALIPKLETDTFGRSGFFIHGDEVGHVGEELASHGCIILPRAVRVLVAAATERTLLVE